jgi:hypothetical protein
VRLLKEDLDRRGVLSKRRTSSSGVASGGHSFSRGADLTDVERICEQRVECKRYKSLSEVARVITGARWSGPRFFGLKSAAKEQPLGTR